MAMLSIAPIPTANAPEATTARAKSSVPTTELAAPTVGKEQGRVDQLRDLGVLVSTDARTETAPMTADLPLSTGVNAPPGAQVIQLRAPSPPAYTFNLRQQWEGVVQHIDDDEFTVVLRDVSSRNKPEVEAVLPLEEVIDDDLPLLQPGAVLYWTIGYERTLAGQLKRVSNIRLRRLPAWSKKDLERVAKRVAEIDELFGR